MMSIGSIQLPSAMRFYNDGCHSALMVALATLEPSGPEARARVFVHVLYEFRDY